MLNDNNKTLTYQHLLLSMTNGDEDSDISFVLTHLWCYYILIRLFLKMYSIINQHKNEPSLLYPLNFHLRFRKLFYCIHLLWSHQRISNIESITYAWLDTYVYNHFIKTKLFQPLLFLQFNTYTPWPFCCKLFHCCVSFN